jgi:SAM-dependent methyltransferase
MKKPPSTPPTNSNQPEASETPITPDEIELINAHGPFNHSVWRGRGVAVTHEEGLAGRVEFLSALVHETIRKEFSDEQLQSMSIADVGCYDGWLLESLGDLPFARRVGIEPRPENIERGRRVREILRIPSRAHYQTGEIGALDGSEQFDVVMCMGVLHHVEAIAPALEKLRSICRRMLILDFVVLPSNHLNEDLRRDVELKDFVYQYKPALYGITAQKYEGQYYPGSGVRLSVVNIPTLETVQMHLDMLGFGPLTILADWNRYRQAIPGFQRPAQFICVAARVDSESSLDQVHQESKWIEHYEQRMMQTLLPSEIIGPLFHVVCRGEPASTLTGAAHQILVAMSQGTLRELCVQYFMDPTQREIAMSLAYCPIDKVRLEYAKLLLQRGEIADAMTELRQITRRLNADWRACYRALFLLWRAATQQGEAAAAERYRGLYVTCNPKMPAQIFAAHDVSRAA